jgi:hypothetical protein
VDLREGLMARLSFWESAGGDVGLVRIRTSRGLLRNPKIRVYRKKAIQVCLRLFGWRYYTILEPSEELVHA